MSSRTIRRSLARLTGAGLLLSCLLFAAAAQATTLPTLTVTLTKTSVTVGGSLQSGAVNVVATATGVKEPSAILFRINPGVTPSEVEKGLKEGGMDPNRTVKYGSIVFDNEVPRSGKSEAQTYLQPGQYIALLPGNGKGAAVHTFFTVTAAVSPAALPAPEATVRSIEFAFRGPSTLRDGELVRFENEGFLVHMDVAIPVKSLTDAKKVVHDLLTGHEKGLEKLASAEPFELAGPMSHEAFMQETITAKPGWYVQACFMNTQDGRDHTLLGMERIFKIVK